MLEVGRGFWDVGEVEDGGVGGARSGEGAMGVGGGGILENQDTWCLFLQSLRAIGIEIGSSLTSD